MINIHVRIHVVPPEQLGAGESGDAFPSRAVPDLLTLDQVVGLPPEPHFGKVPEVPTVTDDTMVPDVKRRTLQEISTFI